MEKLIAMQENLGLGHKGTVIITTQKRVDDNVPCIATVNEPEQALSLVDRWNAHDTLQAQAELLDEMIIEMKHARFFIENKQKMFKVGIEQYDALLKKAEALK